jgi:hypothetical protein
MLNHRITCHRSVNRQSETPVRAGDNRGKAKSRKGQAAIGHIYRFCHYHYMFPQRTGSK